MYKVSVLIPVHNSGTYIGRCLRSAFSQTLGGIEYIIIDDASDDDTLDTIQETAAAFPERAADMRIIHHETNMGPCAARKTGLHAATGQYVIHLDSDDWVEPECYASMYQCAVDTGADVVCCGYVEDHDGHSYRGLFGAGVTEDKWQRLREVISLKASPFIWSKMVRRELLSDPGFRHPDHDMAEDWVLCVQYALLADKWASVDKPFYHYRINAESLSHNKSSKEKAARIMEMEKKNVEAVIGQLNDLSLAGIFSKEIEARKSNVKRFMLPFLSDKAMSRLWKDTFKEINWSMLTNSYIPTEYRIKHLCALLGVYSPLYAAFKAITGKP